MDDNNIDIVRLYETEKVHAYLLRYIDELKLHFNVRPEDLERILYDCYKSVKTPTTVKKILSMVKSLCNRV